MSQLDRVLAAAGPPQRKPVAPGQLLIGGEGEVCVAASRLLVERPVHDRVVERLSRLARDAVRGDPLDPATQIGPTASKAAYDKVLRYVDAGKQSQARLTAGGMSGYGREQGAEALESYTQYKTVWVNLGTPHADPPRLDGV